MSAEQCDHWNNSTGSMSLRPLCCTREQGHDGLHLCGSTSWSEDLGFRAEWSEESGWLLAGKLRAALDVPAHLVPSYTEEEREPDWSMFEQRVTSSGWVCGHDFPGATCDACFNNVRRAREVAEQIAAQPSVPAPAPERCPESWVPAAGGPGHQCVKPAGHDGAHDSRVRDNERQAWDEAVAAARAANQMPSQAWVQPLNPYREAGEGRV